MEIQIDHVLDALTKVIDPERQKDIVRLGLIRDLRVGDAGVQFTIFLDDPLSAWAATVRDSCIAALKSAVGDGVPISVEMDNAMIDLGDGLTDGQDSAGSLSAGVRNTVAVASGKGGVGKSTVAVNLAIALAREGYDVGLVDTDIYGPSIPTMFGLENVRPEVNEQRRIIPPKKFGVKILSMGFLVDPDQAVIWRGPMVSSATKQFLGETEWGELDFLILDLPPGTGDIQLTIVQTISLTGAIIVSTPQKVALADARKGVAMFDQVGVPVLGIVENMAFFSPPDLPDRKYYLFGEGGARALAAELNVPLLAELPLEEELRASCDSGFPVAATDSGHDIFQSVAKKVARQVASRNATRPATEKIEFTTR